MSTGRVTSWSGGELRGDCGRCLGLCCVAPAFAASADFAISKRAGQPCPNLDARFRCSIHERLLVAGFPGCAAYDCFGAGQRVSELIRAGVAGAGLDWPDGWRGAAETAGQIFAVFGVVRELHELAWHLEQALALDVAEPVRAGLSRALARTDRLASGQLAAAAWLDPASPDRASPDPVGPDLGEHFKAAGELLAQASALARAAAPGPGPDLRGEDLAGQDLRGSGLPALTCAGLA